jgi:hypothetical protein
MRLRLVAFALALSGCVTLSAEDCRSTDWYQLGDRDGVSGSQTLLDKYTQECAAHGAKVNDARYLEGWRDGVQRKRTLRF